MTVSGGTYILVLALDRVAEVVVGRLGMCSFPPGYYVYVGSALGGLFARVRRHVRGGDKVYWHIDYLRRHAIVAEVWYVVSDERLECSWCHAVAAMPDARIPVAGFGSSGCGCVSHLVYFASPPSFEGFRHRHGDVEPAPQKIIPEAEGWDRPPALR